MENISRGSIKCYILKTHCVGFTKLIVDTKNVEITCGDCGELFLRFSAKDKSVIVCYECRKSMFKYSCPICGQQGSILWNFED